MPLFKVRKKTKYTERNLSLSSPFCKMATSNRTNERKYLFNVWTCFCIKRFNAVYVWRGNSFSHSIWNKHWSQILVPWFLTTITVVQAINNSTFAAAAAAAMLHSQYFSGGNEVFDTWNITNTSHLIASIMCSMYQNAHACQCIKTFHMPVGCATLCFISFMEIQVKNFITRTLVGCMAHCNFNGV